MTRERHVRLHPSHNQAAPNSSTGHAPPTRTLCQTSMRMCKVSVSTVCFLLFCIVHLPALPEFLPVPIFPYHIYSVVMFHRAEVPAAPPSRSVGSFELCGFLLAAWYGCAKFHPQRPQDFGSSPGWRMYVAYHIYVRHFL